jgi:hypothetical protein
VIGFGAEEGKVVVEGCALSYPEASPPLGAFIKRYRASHAELSLEMRHNTFLNVAPLSLMFWQPLVSEPGRKAGHLRLSDDLFASPEIIQYVTYSVQKGAIASGEGLWLLPSLYQWKEERNAYASGTMFLVGRDDGKSAAVGRDLKTLRDWFRWWSVTDSSSVQGEIRLTGPVPAEQDLDHMSPTQFCLASGSIGKNADSAGRDLGADVDALGRGPAYDAWKKTADYLQWLKETGQ